MDPHPPFDISETKEGFLLLRFSGSLLHDAADVFRIELAGSSKRIESLSAAQRGKIRILLDMTQFTGQYNVETLGMIADFARQNAPYVEKTASFGGSDKVKAAGELATALAGRDNIKIFDTRKEAEEFLLS